MAMRFQNKVALVTGGASGIGKEVATRFVTEGGLVVINGRNRARAEAVAREIDPTGKRVVVHAGDITLPATGEAVVKTAIDRFGRLDVLFNNAGSSRRSRFSRSRRPSMTASSASSLRASSSPRRPPRRP
jgi:NAD(P)-dependent dehydrogenase (short-subunit alcohol dehydrogenase family)